MYSDYKSSMYNARGNRSIQSLISKYESLDNEAIVNKFHKNTIKKLSNSKSNSTDNTTTSSQDKPKLRFNIRPISVAENVVLPNNLPYYPMMITIEERNLIDSNTSYEKREVKRNTLADRSNQADNKQQQPIPRKASLILVKPSSLKENSRANELNRSRINCAAPSMESLVAPKSNAPVYVSRRSSYSSIKPSEIWENGELSTESKRKSIILSDSDSESDDSVKAGSGSWVTRARTSIHVTKPSCVKTGKNFN